MTIKINYRHMRKLFLEITERSARRRVLENPLITISRRAKVKYRNLRICMHGSLQINDGSIVEGELVTEREGATIAIGRDSFVGNSLISCATHIEIGNDVLISWGCNIVDHDSHALSWKDRSEDVRRWYRGEKDWTGVHVAAIKIGDKSWIGFNVGVLKGVTIGEGAIIGAGSVVTKNVAPWTVVAGNPARFIRELPVEGR